MRMMLTVSAVIVLLTVSLSTIVMASDQYVGGFEEPCRVAQGNTGDFELHIQTPNNETASDVIVSVPDPNIFTFTPKNISIGNLPSSAWKTVTFKVYAPETAQAHEYSIMYEISFKDQAGTPHTVGEYATIVVQPRTFFSSFNAVIAIAAVVAAAIVVAVIGLKRLRKTRNCEWEKSKCNQIQFKFG